MHLRKLGVCQSFELIDQNFLYFSRFWLDPLNHSTNLDVETHPATENKFIVVNIIYQVTCIKYCIESIEKNLFICCCQKFLNFSSVSAAQVEFSLKQKLLQGIRKHKQLPSGRTDWVVCTGLYKILITNILIIFLWPHNLLQLWLAAFYWPPSEIQKLGPAQDHS